ncbi:hypothetical protein [Streptomyces sp. t39]|uniref:hypothetical protein n=1 Tax=Streptomyces sp. t39 TaxID=1828156 RepID=UPI0011CD7A9A|nr:hypothetical protein [Streptomyces sp. t39]TXS35089.1 hypothetical protein EAO77_37980 [Streptomyces sp. t39]
MDEPELVFEKPPGLLIFEAPPRTKHLQAAEAVRARPGEWARIGCYGSRDAAASVAWQIRKGVRSAWRPVGAFQAVSRTVGGEFRVYVRYVGEAGNAD